MWVERVFFYFDGSKQTHGEKRRWTLIYCRKNSLFFFIFFCENFPKHFSWKYSTWWNFVAHFISLDLVIKNKHYMAPIVSLNGAAKSDSCQCFHFSPSHSLFSTWQCSKLLERKWTDKDKLKIITCRFQRIYDMFLFPFMTILFLCNFRSFSFVNCLREA